jgi:hypothetical protein
MAGAEAIPIAALRPATRAYLQRADEQRLNQGGDSMRQKTHLATTAVAACGDAS